MEKVQILKGAAKKTAKTSHFARSSEKINKSIHTNALGNNPVSISPLGTK